MKSRMLCKILNALKPVSIVGIFLPLLFLTGTAQASDPSGELGKTYAIYKDHPTVFLATRETMRQQDERHSVATIELAIIDTASGIPVMQKLAMDQPDDESVDPLFLPAEPILCLDHSFVYEGHGKFRCNQTSGNNLRDPKKIVTLAYRVNFPSNKSGYYYLTLQTQESR